MVIGDVTYGLPGAGIFDDTVRGTAVRAEALLRCRDVERDPVIVLESFDLLNRGFLRQFCQIIGCFHCRFRPPWKIFHSRLQKSS